MPAADLNNIVTINIDWTRAQVGKDFQQHDVVVVSRSLPSGLDIAGSLKLIDAAAKRLCYVTWKARGYDELERELSELLGIPYVTFPCHIVIYNLLHALALTPMWSFLKRRVAAAIIRLRKPTSR